jgi:hypothetical protein
MVRRLVLIVALTLVAAGGSYRPALAAEPSGPSTPAAPSACAGVASLFAIPALLSPAALPAAAPLQICGCGDSACMGRVAGTRCGTGGSCVPNGHCVTSPPTWVCVCAE